MRKGRACPVSSLTHNAAKPPKAYLFFIMELLDIGFAILLIKMVICVMPGVIGIFFIASPEETKRHLRSTVSNRLFGVSNVIPYPKFARFLYISGTILLFISIGLSWLILLRSFFIQE